MERSAGPRAAGQRRHHDHVRAAAHGHGHAPAARTARALGRYDTAGAHDATTPADDVAREALEAAREGRATAVRWGVRWQHALDALAPGVVARQVALRWRGGAR